MNAALAYQRINVPQARELLKRSDLLLLDSRDPQAYAKAHIDNAQPLNSRTMDGLIFNAPKQQPVLIYCYHGHSSQVHAQTFIDFGFREVYSLDGGYEAWHNAQSIAAVVDQAVTHSQSLLQRWLGEQGFADCKPNTVIANHTTPLMKACRIGDKDIVLELLRLGVPLNVRNADGNNALWHACIQGDLDILQLLIDTGIDLDNQNTIGVTCVMFAALTGKASVLRTLLKAGAATHLRAHDGMGALDIVSTPACGDLLRYADELFTQVAS